MEIGLPLIFLLVAVLLTCLVFSIVGDMAKARGHSPWPWWIISLCWSPFGWTINQRLFLSLKGNSDIVQPRETRIKLPPPAPL